MAQGSKSAPTKKNRSTPSAPTNPSSGKFPPHWVDKTSERSGETLPIVGAPQPGPRHADEERHAHITIHRPISIRKREYGAETNRPETWVLEHYNQAGKRRRKTFKSRRDAEQFAKTIQVLNEGSIFLDNDELDFTIHQDSFSGRIPKPLTVGSVISQIGKVWRENARVSDAERAFLIEFAAATDRGRFIENNFLGAAINGGKRLKTETYSMPDADDEEGGWAGLHRFFGIYIVNCTQYGEGEDEYGPFPNREDADDAFGWIVVLCFP